jgi:hypothetical protein
LLKSTFIWTVFFLLVVELTARLSAPPAAKNIVDSSTRIEAFKQFCREKHNADVAILGSSLALAATFERGGESDCKFSVDDWSKSISQTIGRDVQVVNLAWHAGMFSDCNKTLKAYLHSQKTPQIVLLMTAPREFSDNLTAQTGVLAGYSVEPDSFTTLDRLQNAESLYSQALVLAEIVLPGKLLNQLISNDDGTCSKALNTVVTYYSETFREHKIAHDKIVEFCVKHLQRPETLAGAINYPGKSTLDKRTVATRSQTPEFSPFERDIAMYRQRYNPTNAKNVKQAEIALKELQETCTAKGIYLIILNMPLTRENRALIAPETYTNFIEKLNSAASSPNCLLVDAGKNSNFSNSDFHDSVHLNRSGKEKLRELIFPALTEKLTDQKNALTVGTKSGTVHDTNQ